jgi:hypothetical protein
MLAHPTTLILTGSISMTIYQQFLRPQCKHCGRPCTSKGKTKHGFTIWRDVCTSCHKKPYRIHKSNTCDKCGFIPEWIGQLDVDHIDGNHQNNSPENLQTLCANCHRLKTHLNEDYLSIR